MLRFHHKTLLIISGLIWLGAGGVLLPLGLSLIVGSAQTRAVVASSHSLPLLDIVAESVGGWELAVVALVAVSLILGLFKGHFILSESARRQVRRIRSLPNPTHFLKLYSPAYYLLLASMMLTGMLIKFLGVPHDIRGGVDVVIGLALIKSSTLYFRSAFVEPGLEESQESHL